MALVAPPASPVVRAVPASTSADAGGRVLWSTIAHHTPSSPSRHRVGVWRELHRMGALHLHQGRWIVAHGEHGGPPIDRLQELVRDAGGTLECRPGDPPGTSGAAEVDQACHHLWDAFFNDADLLVAGFEHGADPRDWLAGLEDLRAAYRENRCRDLLDSSASLRACARLDDLYVVLVDADLASATVVAAGGRFGPSRCLPGAERAFDDGTVEYVELLDPAPSAGWELAFRAFEARIYTPSPDRVPIEHGAFVHRERPDERDGVLARITGRVELFEASL